MWGIFNALRDVTLLSVICRMLLAVLCGGIIGIEREFKRRPAGFRTHILICLGAAMTTMTSQYLSLTLHYHTDIARLGAQVVAGIGFIGAGTIIVTGNQRVKGLTTAAGLWTTAIVGLAIGAGFLEGGIIVTILILAAELLLIRVEYRTHNNAPEVNLYVEYSRREYLDDILKCYQNRGVKVLNMQITSSTESDTRNFCVIFTLRLNKNCSMARLSSELQAMSGVLLIEEL